MNTQHHSAFFSAAALLAVLIVAGGVSFAAENIKLYGCPWAADGLVNIEIGRSASRRVSYRFRAEHSGVAESVRIFLIFRKLGYYKGDGGQLLAELHEDDGSPAHLPANRPPLTSCLIEDPLAGQRANLRLLRFDRAARLEKSRLYHLVFTNPAPDPLNNFVSVNNLHLRRHQPAMQPAASDLDLAVICKFNDEVPWQPLYGRTPIFCLRYADGAAQGQGYFDARSQSAVCKIAGEHTVREVFTVSGSDRIASAVTVRLRKTGAPGDLRIRLEDSIGAPLEECLVTAADVSDGLCDWITAPLKTKPILRRGGSYKLVLSAPPGDPYETFAIQSGRPVGFDTPNLFEDGHFEATGDEHWRGRRTDFDLQFYFATVITP